MTNLTRFSLAVCLTLSTSVMLRANTLASMTRSTSDNRQVTITAVTDNVIKVTNIKVGERVPTSRAAAIDEANSHAQIDIDGNRLTTQSGITVIVGDDGSVTIDGGGGRTLYDSGKRIDGAHRAFDLTVSGGSFYGAGERGHRLKLNGDTLVMYNRQNYGYTGGDPRISQMNITMPLLVSSKGYGVVYDDFAAARLVVGDKLSYDSESPSPVSYYYVNSVDGTIAGVVTAMTELTGRQELPPLWTMGYVTSKYGYHTQEETVAVVDSLKTAGYPVDGIVLDLYWYGKEQDMGRFAWDKEAWPNPRKMLSDLKKKGVNLITISQPYILRNARAIDNYNELNSRGLMLKDANTGESQEVKIWVGEGGMFDVSNPQTRLWMSNKYAELIDMGVGGLWGDLGEPEVHPETGLHYNGLTARQYHNQYGNDWSQIKYDTYKSCFPDKRIILMMRGGTTGLQRYDVFPWSTDVSRSWGGLEPQVRIMLNSGMSGLGYMGHDVGGFAIDPKNPVDEELYVRWLQLGTFSPMLRTHAQYKAEPYGYPKQQDIILPLIRERYRWLPYNYTLAWENANMGWPLVRPLNFHDAEATDAYDAISDQYLWGKDVMVAPVMTQGAKSRSVTFPAGSDWVDLSNPKKVYKGGTTARYNAPLNMLPMFARAGAFIPTAEYAMESTLDYKADTYTINYYPAGNSCSSYTMFEDDMTTPTSIGHNNGLLIDMDGDDLDDAITITLSTRGAYAGMNPVKALTIRVLGLTKKPKAVTVDDNAVDFTFDKKNGVAELTLSYDIHDVTTVILTK